MAAPQAEVVAHNLAAEWAGQTPGREFDGTGACFIETGSGRVGYGAGEFYAEPAPAMRLRSPSRLWHLGKVLFEKYWFWKWFRKEILWRPSISTARSRLGMTPPNGSSAPP